MAIKSNDSVKSVDHEWVRFWEEKMEGLGADQGQLEPGTGSIFRVPEHIKATDPSAYEPQVVSIGPYHHDNTRLKPMERVKLIYLRGFLKRNNQSGLRHYLQLIVGLTARARSCYSKEINMSNREFSNVLLLDGCFIIELLLAHHFRNNQQQQEDPILDNMLTLSLVEFDMLLLENQLPFFILKSLFDLVDVSDEENQLSLVQIASKFFKGLIKGLVPLPDSPPSSMSFYHLLHLFHACFIGRPVIETQQSNIPDDFTPQNHVHGDFPTESMLMTPSASDLMNVDVKFKRKSDQSFSWKISYEQGIIEISHARLTSNSNSFYRNLVAFEQHFFRSVRSRVMAYVMLMSCLIDSENDLALLRRERIIAYTLGCNEATFFFRKLCKDSVMDYDRSYLSRLQDRSMKVWKLYDTKWIRYKAKLKRSYFRNPINIIYLTVSAVLFIVLTTLQTVYTVLAYYQRPK